MAQTINSNFRIPANSPDVNTVLGQALNGFATELDTTAGAIGIKNGTVILNGAGALAMTLAAPVATTDDFKELRIVSVGAFAHTVTTPATKLNGLAIATFAAAKGNAIILVAFQGVWYSIASTGITVS
jgi:hypothetical protein